MHIDAYKGHYANQIVHMNFLFPLSRVDLLVGAYHCTLDRCDLKGGVLYPWESAGSS